MNKYPQGFKDALAALYGEHKPMTADELAAHESACASATARLEAERNSSQQPDLLDEAA